MNKNGLVLWILAGAGVLFIYAAYKNQNPQTIIANHLQGTAVSSPISNFAGTTVPTVTDGSGKSWDVANGSGVPGITGSPPIPGGTSSGGYMLGSIVRDTNGNPLGMIPAGYAGNPNLYIATGAVNA